MDLLVRWPLSNAVSNVSAFLSFSISSLNSVLSRGETCNELSIDLLYRSMKFDRFSNKNDFLSDKNECNGREGRKKKRNWVKKLEAQFLFFEEEEEEDSVFNSTRLGIVPSSFRGTEQGSLMDPEEFRSNFGGRFDLLLARRRKRRRRRRHEFSKVIGKKVVDSRRFE